MKFSVLTLIALLSLGMIAPAQAQHFSSAYSRRGRVAVSPAPRQNIRGRRTYGGYRGYYRQHSRLGYSPCGPRTRIYNSHYRSRGGRYLRPGYQEVDHHSPKYKHF